MVATATKVYPITNVKLSTEQYYWLTKMWHKDKVTPSARVAMLVQKEIERLADLARYGEVIEDIPDEMSTHVDITVRLERSIFSKIKSLGERSGLSPSRTVGYAAERLVGRRK